MPRYRRPLRSDELYHWGTPKDTKYVAKIGEGEDARYFYSEAEYRAYQLGKSVKQKASNTLNAITGGRDKADMKKASETRKEANLQNANARSENSKRDLHEARKKAREADSDYKETKEHYENKTLPGIAKKAGNKISKSIDDFTGRKELAAYKESKSDANEYATREKRLQREMDKDRNKYDSRVRRNTKNGVKNTAPSNYHAITNNDLHSSLKELNKAEKIKYRDEARKHLTKYHKTPIGKLSYKISKGASAVKRLLK